MLTRLLRVAGPSIGIGTVSDQTLLKLDFSAKQDTWRTRQTVTQKLCTEFTYVTLLWGRGGGNGDVRSG